MADSYAELVKGRTLASKLIKRLQAKCQATEAEAWNEAVINMQKSALERHWTSFQTKQLSIAELVSIGDSARDRNESVAIKVANLYHETKQRLAALMVVANPNHNRPLPKISEIKLSKFDGDYTKWVSWRAQFLNKVLETELPPGSKIDLLQSALEGEARKCAGEAEHRDVHDLDRIWKKLGETYDNPYQIVTAHVNQLIDIPTMEYGQADKLRSIIDTVEQECRSLNRFDCNTDSWSPFLAVYILRKLDKSTRAAWEMDRDPTAPPSLTELLPFLERRIFAMRNLRGNNHGLTGAQENRASGDPRAKRPMAERDDHNTKRPRLTNDSAGGKQVAIPVPTGKTGDVCSNCNGGHRTWNCEKLARMEYNDRLKKIKELNVCESCLSSHHPTHSCTWKGCKVCNYAKHNRMNCPKYPVMSVNHTNRSLGHRSSKGRNQQRPFRTPRCHTVTSQNEQSASEAIESSDEGLPIIGTALCRLHQDNGTLTGNVRILCDSGSQVNLITQECVQKWNLVRKPCKISVAGIGNTEPIRSYGYIDCLLCHRDNMTAAETVRFVIVKRISGTNPQAAFRCQLKNQFHQDELADPTFTEPAHIEGLIGISTWAAVIREGIIRADTSVDRFIAQDSMLGWVISGHAGNTNLLRHLTFHVAESNDNLDMQMERFWAVDDKEDHVPLSLEEQRAEDIFTSTHSRDENGRYIVTIPLREDTIKLGRSRDTAFKRFVGLENRLKRNPDMAAAYKDFMLDYLKEGHMVPAPPAPEDPSLSYYIPYHIISKKKFRVVFDASCKTSSGISFNEQQLPGGKLQADLYETLLLFRTYRFALTADIVKMFRQVKIHPDHWNFQRIFFRPEIDEPIGEYFITRVIWGFTSSGFNAVRALQQCAADEAEEFHIASAATLQNFYVDDFLGGAESVEELKILHEQMTGMLKAGGFQLSKWATNNIEFAETLTGDEPVEVQLQGSSGILGIIWEPKSDNMYIKVHEYPVDSTKPLTKRQIISNIAQVYDPTGLYSPVIVAGKIIIQEIWKLNLGWDDVVPGTIMELWSSFQRSVIGLANIPVHRWTSFSKTSTMQLHIFSDASKLAYGACAYLRSTQPDGTVMVRLVTSRNKVAPIKAQTIPRLELMAAVMSTNLGKLVTKAFMLRKIDTFYWCDSSIVLYWLRKNPQALKPFVAHRVASILASSSINEWRHVPGDQNPADLLSRGCTASQLRCSTTWWSGPLWLQGELDSWPSRTQCSLSADDITTDETESKVTPLCASTNMAFVPSQTNPDIGGSPSLVQRCSSLNKLLRTTAFVFRFIDGARNKSRNVAEHPAHFREVNPVSPTERDRAAKYWARQAQTEFFSGEWKALQEKKGVPSNSKLLQLCPFVDPDGVMRVGGRLGKSNLPAETKHPIIIHAASAFAKLIMWDAHNRAMHGGTQLTISIIRQKFWIPNVRAAVKKLIRSCVICARFRKDMAQQLMGPLPASRTELTFPFAAAGVDFAGPFEVRKAPAASMNLRLAASRTYKPPTTIKCWVVVFVCMTTRAVHLDLSHGLSVEAFLEVFTRFVSRRGHCAKLYSDNGTNFVGTNNELQRVRQEWKNEMPIAELANLGTTWQFNSPAAPHQGGLWEACVKSMKYHLRRVMGRRILSANQLYTILTQIECCLNSRPLSPLNDDHNDLEILTPGHFLIGRPLMHHPPAEDLTKCNDNRLTLWGQQQKLTQAFWRRWKNDYLISLQKRTKWYRPRENIKPGDMVVVLEENRPPAIWPVGRVEHVYPGMDGLVRNVRVRTSTGLRDRPIQKLCVLPVEHQ